MRGQNCHRSKKVGLKKLALIALTATLVACSNASTPPAPQPTPTSWTFGNSVITATAEKRFGSSLTHVVAHGFDYDNIVDHGREWQGAWQLDGLDEGENPTEAGSVTDSAGPASSTQILNAQVTAPNQFISCVHPAFWYPYQGQLVSPDTMCKTVTVGLPGLPNVIEWKVGIDIAADHTEGHFEPLAGYSPYLPMFYTQQADGSFAVTPSTIGGTDVPGNSWIVASTDGQQALGMLAVKPPGLDWNQPNFLNSGTNSFGCGWISVPLKAGHYDMTCYVAVGTLDEVKASLTALGR